MYQVYVYVASLEKVPGRQSFVEEVLEGFEPRKVEGISALVLAPKRNIFHVSPRVYEDGVTVFTVTTTGNSGNNGDDELMERVAILEQAGVEVSSVNRILQDGQPHYMTRRFLTL